MTSSAPSEDVAARRAANVGIACDRIHESELLAAFDIPSKLAAPAFDVARLIESGQCDTVQEQCGSDVIGTALLLCRWRKLHDPRVDADMAEDRILRRVCELRAGRGYIAAFKARRAARFAAQIDKASNDAARLAPWLDQDAA